MIRSFVTYLSFAMLAACDGPSETHSGLYAGGDQTALLQLNVLEGGDGQITGSIAVSELDYSAGQMKLTTRPITGTRNGEQFSLVAHGGGWGVKDAPLFVHASGNALVLQFPGTGQSLEMQRMEQAQYRQKLAEFAAPLNANGIGSVAEE